MFRMFQMKNHFCSCFEHFSKCFQAGSWKIQQDWGKVCDVKLVENVKFILPGLPWCEAINSVSKMICHIWTLKRVSLYLSVISAILWPISLPKNSSWDSLWALLSWLLSKPSNLWRAVTTTCLRSWMSSSAMVALCFFT